MSLQGSLSQLSLSDLLQGALGTSTGNFHMRKGGARAVLHLEAGELKIVAPDSLPAGALLRGLIHRGELDDAHYRTAAQTMGPTEILDRFVAEGRVPGAEVDRLLTEASEDAILDLLTWRSGEFKFVEGEPVPEEAGPISRVAADLSSVLLRAAQRLDERTAIENGLGPHPHLFLPVLDTPPKPGFEGDPVGQVHALIDGTHLLDEIATLAGLTHFVTLRAVLACVGPGIARPATGDELWAAATKRTAHGETRAARLLFEQWASIEPGQRSVPELAEAEQALRLLRGRLTRHPDDARVLAALASVAEASGDEPLHVGTVLTLVRLALADDEPDRAIALLDRLESDHGLSLEAHELRGHAFVALRNEPGLVGEAEALREHIGKRCRGSRELAAAAFFSDALAELAPDRRDLILQLRTARRLASPMRRFGPIAALLLLVATAGVVFRPESAGSILDKAQDAAAKGNDTEALQHIADLAERFPDAPETKRASALHRSLPSLGSGPQVRPEQLTLDDERVQTLMAAAEAALPQLPDPEAGAAVNALGHLLLVPEASSLRRTVVGRLTYAVGRSVERVCHEIDARADAFEQAAELAGSREPDAKALRGLVARAGGWAKDAYATDAAEAVAAVQRLLHGSMTPSVRKSIRELEQALERLAHVAETHAPALDDCRREVARIDLRAAHESCLTEASELLTAGRLDEAGACYGALRSLLETIAEDPVLQPLQVEVERRGMQRLLDLRGGILSEIRRSLDSATALEETGDLEAAIEAYTGLAQRFSSIRFENVIQVPLEVTTVPGGARVHVNGELAGTAPLVVHLPWNTKVELTADRPGYEKTTHRMAVGEGIPSAVLRLDLAPEAAWSVTVDAAVTTAPVAAEKDLVICDRTGRVHLHRGDDGEVVWSRRIEGLEDIRARPAVSGGLVYLPLIDGRVHLLELYDGRPSGSFKLSGNLCGSAVLGDLVAVVSLQGDLTALRGRNTAFTSPLGGTPSAGVFAAHGVFWIGTDDGSLIRLNPKEKGLRIKLPGRSVPVRGLTSHADGILLSKADGSLHALAADGSLRWSVDAVGELIGSPAAVAGRAACIDARGRVVLFDLADGTPKGQIDLGAASREGFLQIPDLLVTSLVDGRLWIHDPATSTERAFVDLGADETWFGVAAFGDDHLVAPAADRAIRLLKIPEGSK